MGFVPGLLGIGNKGQNWSASGTPIAQPISAAQAQQAYNGSQDAIQQQQNFVNAVLAQNGLGNQANVFAQQQALANQLQNQANGQGPNPALAQLNQTTGQNIANQAALMAGQRGASANAGLIARQAAQQGAATQQQAAGQAAIQSAQQQIAAQQALQNQQANMANLATQQVGQQQNALGALNQFNQNQESNLFNQTNAQNNANVSMQSNLNNANAGIQGVTAQGQNQLLGNVMGGVGSAVGLAHGGMVKNYAEGGAVPVATPDAPRGGFIANFLQGVQPGSISNIGSVNIPQGSGMKDMNFDKSKANPADVEDTSAPNVMAAAAGQGDLMLPAAEAIAPAMLAAAKGGAIDGEELAAQGATVPGKANVAGDSLKNDIVPARLSPGEIVIPRHITMGKNPAEESAKFVAAVLANKRRRG